MLLVSAEGRPIARRGAIKDRPVTIPELDPLTPAAFIAIEDRRFRRHWGVDPRAIGRAMVANVQAGGVRQGGSTITQQLAKTSFLSSDRSLKRKAQEVIIAFWLEGWLTKDEILSRYLSSVYFGDGVYGLRAASRHYFGRAPQDLNLGQSAMLAGMVQAPSRLAPTKNLTLARKRSKLVLQAMADTGVITPARARGAKLARPVAQPGKVPTGTYFADWVAPAAQKAFEADFGEVRVPTTLDADLQRIAVRAIANASIGDAQAALVAMRPDGRVVAMVGGRSYKKSPFNRATQARRQPGSAFKLFVYLAALRAGYRPTDMIEDSPITIDGWSPANVDGVYRGRITLREAFLRSSNAAAVRLSERVGRQNVLRAARELGISSPLPDSPSVALGTAGVSLLELTGAYAAIAGGRYPVQPRGLPLDRQEEGLPPSSSAAARWTGSATGARCSTLLWAAPMKAPADARRWASRPSARPERPRTTATPCSSALPATWWSASGSAATTTSRLGKMTGGTAPARLWRNFMASALAVDGRRGPALPRDYRRRSLPGPEPEKQSPLPEEWSEPAEAIRAIAETLDELINGR